MQHLTEEARFLLSLDPGQRDYVTDALEEALILRAEGLSRDEIAGRLAHAVLAAEGWSDAPGLARRIILGEQDNQEEPA